MINKIMNSDIVKLNPEDTIRKALNMMNENKENGAPVVDGDGKIVGMIVKADIYRFLMEAGHYDTCPVEWVMTKNVITASEEEGILDIAKRLRENEIVAIPIVDNGILKGMVSIEDVLDYIIKSHE